MHIDEGETTGPLLRKISDVNSSHRIDYYTDSLPHMLRISAASSARQGGIGSGIPSALSQQLPRESMAKCAKSLWVKSFRRKA